MTSLGYLFLGQLKVRMLTGGKFEPRQSSALLTLTIILWNFVKKIKCIWVFGSKKFQEKFFCFSRYEIFWFLKIIFEEKLQGTSQDNKFGFARS